MRPVSVGDRRVFLLQVGGLVLQRFLDVLETQNAKFPSLRVVRLLDLVKSISASRRRFGHLFAVDVGLAAVHDADDAEFDGDDAAAQNVHGVRAVVHEVELGDHRQSAST